MDSRKLLCCSLEIGVLVLGILSFISGLLFFITDILTIANWEKVEHNAAMKVLLGEASLTTVEFVYTIFGLIDILGSALLIAGIVMVSIWKKRKNKKTTKIESLSKLSFYAFFVFSIQQFILLLHIELKPFFAISLFARWDDKNNCVQNMKEKKKF